jgi:hypothetical protein
MIQPVRAKDNSPPIHRWVADWNGIESCQGRQNPVLFSDVFFRPSGACGKFERDNPAMNRWAIFGRPGGTGTNGDMEK